MDEKADKSPKETWLTGHDRSRLALAEVGAAVLLIVSFALPWFQVTNLDSAGVAIGGTDSLSWENAPGAYAIGFGAMAAVAAALAGLAFPGRGKLLLTLAAFAVAAYGLIPQLSYFTSGSMDPPETRPALGLWLFAGAALGGVAVASIDLLRAGSSTFASKALARPSMKWYLILSAIALAVSFAEAKHISDSSGFWAVFLMFALPLGILLSAPSLRAAAAAGLVAIVLAELVWPTSSSTTLAAYAGYAFLAGIALAVPQLRAMAGSRSRSRPAN